MAAFLGPNCLGCNPPLHLKCTNCGMCDPFLGLLGDGMLSKFNVEVEIGDVKRGPVVTRSSEIPLTGGNAAGCLVGEIFNDDFFIARYGWSIGIEKGGVPKECGFRLSMSIMGMSIDVFQYWEGSKFVILDDFFGTHEITMCFYGYDGCPYSIPGKITIS